jgi:hypothetical protein
MKSYYRNTVLQYRGYASLVQEVCGLSQGGHGDSGGAPGHTSNGQPLLAPTVIPTPRTDTEIYAYGTTSRVCPGREYGGRY